LILLHKMCVIIILIDLYRSLSCYELLPVNNLCQVQYREYYLVENSMNPVVLTFKEQI